MHQSDVTLTLIAEEQIDSEMLEDYTFSVLAAVEEHAGDLIEGPVVAADFAANAIELDFTVCHDSQSDAQHKITQVLALIEQHSPVLFGAHDASVRATEVEEHAATL